MAILTQDRIKEIKNTKSIGKGLEGIVYQDENIAYKFYHEHPRKPIPPQKRIETFIKIPAKREIMPIDIIQDESLNLLGQMSTYEKSSKDKTVYDLTSEKFLDELYFMKDDGDIFSDYGFIRHDLNELNTIFNGMILFCDQGSYLPFVKGMNLREIKKENLKSVNKYIKYYLLFYREADFLPTRKEIKDQYPIDKTFLGDIIQDDILKYDTVGDYVHSLRLKR